MSRKVNAILSWLEYFFLIGGVCCWIWMLGGYDSGMFAKLARVMVTVGTVFAWKQFGFDRGLTFGYTVSGCWAIALCAKIVSGISGLEYLFIGSIAVGLLLDVLRTWKPCKL